MIGRHENAGFSMIEVLISIVIIMVGLLGLAGLQVKAFTVQMESYQRSQALTLLKDMSGRMEANRKNAASYVIDLNPAASCPAVGVTTAAMDINYWCNALLGAAETLGGVNVGAMIGARGCITEVMAPATGVPAQYLIEVAWQGLSSTAVPTLTCGQDEYGPNDALRRVIAIPVNIANLL